MYFPLESRKIGVMETRTKPEIILHPGQRMSRVPCQTGGMNMKKSYELHPAPPETIARFGRVRLIRNSGGRHELIGGTVAERRTARAWCSRHTPFLLFDDPVMLEFEMAA